MPEVSLTRATLRSAEFGFLGVVVYTRVHTPRRWGEPFRAGVLVLPTLSWRPLRTSWLIVGNLFSVRRLWVITSRVRDSLVWPLPTPDVGRVGRGALPCTSHPWSARTRVRPEPHVDCPAREVSRRPAGCRLGAWTSPDTASESTGCRGGGPNPYPAAAVLTTRSAEPPVARVDVQHRHPEPFAGLAGPVGVEGVLHGVRLGDDDDLAG